jgi:hypothetical protein
LGIETSVRNRNLRAGPRRVNPHFVRFCLVLTAARPQHVYSIEKREKSCISNVLIKVPVNCVAQTRFIRFVEQYGLMCFAVVLTERQHANTKTIYTSAAGAL